MVWKEAGQVIELPRDLDRLHGARGEQDRDLRPMDANPPRQLEAIGRPRHLDIAEHDIERDVARGQELDGVVARRSFDTR